MILSFKDDAGGDEWRLFLALENGVCQDARVAAASDVETAHFLLDAGSTTWRQLFRREVTAAHALTSGSLHMERGELGWIIVHIRALQALIGAVPDALEQSRGAAARLASGRSATSSITPPVHQTTPSSAWNVAPSETLSPASPRGGWEDGAKARSEAPVNPLLTVPEGPDDVLALSTSAPSTSTDSGATLVQPVASAALSRPTKADIRRAGRGVRFYMWRHTRPFQGGLLMIVHGLLTLAPGFLLLKLAILPGVNLYASLVIGCLLIGMGLITLTSPHFAQITGAMGIVLALSTLIVALGGLVIGLPLGLQGAALAIAWRPNAKSASAKVQRKIDQVRQVDGTM